jgi:alcohol oxidase
MEQSLTFFLPRIHITDKENVIAGYEFDAGFLNHPSDLKK